MADNDGSGNLLNQIAHPAQMNYLAAYGQAQQVAQGVWANRKFQADQLAGQAQQGAINPDGTYDPERYRQNLQAAGPGAALATQSGMAANQSLSDAQLAQARQKTDYVAKASAGALDAGDYSDGAMMKILQQGSASGMLTMPEIAKQLQTMPQDATGRKAWLEQHRAQALSQGQALELQYGKPTTVDDGQTIKGGTQSVQTGGLSIPQGQGVPTYPSRTALLTQQTGVDAQGRPTSDTLANRAVQQGQGGLTGPAGQRSPLGTGGFPSALRNPANAPAPGPVATGQTPAQQAAQTKTGDSSAEAFQQISKTGVEAQSRAALLDNILSDTTQFKTGPGSDAILKIRQIADRFGYPIDKDATSASESFGKLVAQINSAQGAGSDARLSVAQAGNVHKDMSPAGIDLMARSLRGNEDYAMARSKLAASYPDKANSADFEATVGKNLDPRAFQYSRMTPDQKGTYYASIKDKPAFKQAYIWAEKQGLIGGTNAGQ